MQSFAVVLLVLTHAAFGAVPKEECTDKVCKAESENGDSNVLLQSKVQTSVEMPTDDDSNGIKLALHQQPGVRGPDTKPESDLVRALNLIQAVKTCLADRIQDADDANDTDKAALLDAVLEGEVYKLMLERKIPLTALPDRLPWAHDKMTANAGILAGTDAAEQVAQDDFESAVHNIFPHNSSNSSSSTHADLRAFAEKVSVFLDMCGDSKEVEDMTGRIASLQSATSFDAQDTNFLMATAGYVSNKCQLDTLDLHYFVSNVGPGNIPKRNAECSSLLKSSMLAVLTKNHKHAPRFPAHSQEESTRTEYCERYSTFAARKPGHWISRSKELKTYVDCFCVQRQPEKVCSEEHASELLVVREHVEDILHDLPDPSKLAKEFQGLTELNSGANVTAAVTFGPCDTPLDCELCLGQHCLTSSWSKVGKTDSKGRRYKHVDSRKFEKEFEHALTDPGSCFSGSCTPCMAIKPGDPVAVKLQMGISVEKCSSSLDAMTSFYVHITPQVCVGGELGDVLEKIGLECRDLGQIAFYPFLNKMEAYVDFGPGKPMPIPLTRARWTIKLVLGEMSDAVFNACRNLGAGSILHFNCLRTCYKARGHGEIGLKVETGIDIDAGFITINEWHNWWENTWPLGDHFDTCLRARSQAGFSPQDFVMGPKGHKCDENKMIQTRDDCIEAAYQFMCDGRMYHENSGGWHGWNIGCYWDESPGGKLHWTPPTNGRPNVGHPRVRPFCFSKPITYSYKRGNIGSTCSMNRMISTKHECMKASQLVGGGDLRYENSGGWDGWNIGCYYDTHPSGGLHWVPLTSGRPNIGHSRVWPICRQ